MDARHRSNILRAYATFAPASVAVITRIEHMEQVPNIDVYCQQLYEDGLLEKTLTPYGVEEYSLTTTGISLLSSNKKREVAPTKFTIFDQLREKESNFSQIKKGVATLLETSGYMTLLQIHHHISKVHQNVPIPIINSILYSLLATDTIINVGPLYGFL